MGKRNIIPDIELEEKYFGKIRKADFIRFVLPVSLGAFIPNFMLILIDSTYNLLLLSVGVMSVGTVTLLFYEVEYCYRIIDIIMQVLNYHKKGDRLYEKFQKDE